MIYSVVVYAHDPDGGERVRFFQFAEGSCFCMEEAVSKAVNSLIPETWHPDKALVWTASPATFKFRERTRWEPEVWEPIQ